jgi:hypothetical protein
MNAYTLEIHHEAAGVWEAALHREEQAEPGMEM